MNNFTNHLNKLDTPNIPNQSFKRDYDKIFKENPVAANLFLLLFEIADDAGTIVGLSDQDIVYLSKLRFGDDYTKYQL
jgi:hypothetical protein